MYPGGVVRAGWCTGPGYPTLVHHPARTTLPCLSLPCPVYSCWFLPCTTLPSVLLLVHARSGTRFTVGHARSDTRFTVGQRCGSRARTGPGKPGGGPGKPRSGPEVVQKVTKRRKSSVKVVIFWSRNNSASLLKHGKKGLRTCQKVEFCQIPSEGVINSVKNSVLDAALGPGLGGTAPRWNSCLRTG